MSPIGTYAVATELKSCWNFYTAKPFELHFLDCFNVHGDKLK